MELDVSKIIFLFFYFDIATTKMILVYIYMNGELPKNYMVHRFAGRSLLGTLRWS